MNIRSISNPAQVLGKEQIEASKSIKSDEATEREANGQQPQGEHEGHRPLTPEELEKVLGKIRSHEGITKHGLLVKAVDENGQKIVRIETPDGKVLRRIVESDLFFYLYQKDKDSLQLVDKSA